MRCGASEYFATSEESLLGVSLQGTMPTDTDTEPVVVFASRYHRAARDGLKEIAAEAKPRESNAKDDDGLTPTLWAAFSGNIDVLRVFVSRGGDPGKHDRFGNTGLHLAAAGGHTKCVVFLIAMGQDVWAMNIDGRTPRDLAAACPNGETALRLLDAAMAKEDILDPKKVKAKKERAKHRAQKLNAEYRKHHEKEKRYEEAELYNMMERSQSIFNLDPENPPRRHSDASLASSVATGATGSTSGSIFSVVRLQALQRGRRISNTSKHSNMSNASNVSSVSTGTQNRHFQFKVGSVNSDGSRVARPLPGIAPSTEVLFVNGVKPSYRRHSLMSTDSSVPLESVTDAFDLEQQENVVVVTPPVDPDNDEEDPSEVYYKSRHRNSIFDRPGFGNVAFRHSLTGLETSTELLAKSNWIFKNPVESSEFKNLEQSDFSDALENFQEEDEEEERSPLHAFLVSWNLSQFTSQLNILFRGDLDALLAVTSDDLRLTEIPMGPRKKLLRAIGIHNGAIECPPSMENAETRL